RRSPVSLMAFARSEDATDEPRGGLSLTRRRAPPNKPRNTALRFIFLTGSASLQSLEDDRHRFDRDLMGRRVESGAAPFGDPGVDQIPTHSLGHAVAVNEND